MILNKTVKALSLSLILASTAVVANVAEAAQKIGYVNTAKIFQMHPKREAALQELQEEFKDKSAEIQALEAKIKTKMEQARRDGELLGEEGMRALQIEVATLEAEYKLKRQSFERDGKQREAEEKQELFREIQKTIEVVAAEEGFDMIIDAQALQYAKPELDLTDAVINKIK
jgi:outer membrane protein